MNHSMNIVIAINSLYARYAYVMLTSLFQNNTEPMDIYVLYYELNSSSQQMLAKLVEQTSNHIHFIQISDDFLPPEEALHANSWGIETYFRLLIMDLLPKHVDRALYIDADMIINRPITDFYHQDLNGKRLAACMDFVSQPVFGDYRDNLFLDCASDNFHYFNAGFTLFDVAALRLDFNFKVYMDTAKKLNYQIMFPDQDLLNYCHRGDVLFRDQFVYNLYARRAYTDHGIRYAWAKEHTAVIHYASAKPWHGNCYHCDIEQLWWDYAKNTPFYHDFLEETIKSVMTDDTLFRYINEMEGERQQLYQIIDQYETILKRTGVL